MPQIITLGFNRPKRNSTKSMQLHGKDSAIFFGNLKNIYNRQQQDNPAKNNNGSNSIPPCRYQKQNSTIFKVLTSQKFTRLFPNPNLSTNSHKHSTVDQSFNCKKIIAKVRKSKPIIQMNTRRIMRQIGKIKNSHTII